MKFNPLPEIVAGKRVVVVDDSIVRGNTTRQIVAMLKDAGAKEVHLRISAPPIRHPCHYGIDMSTREEMIAHDRTVEEIAEELGADSLAYLSMDAVYEAVGTPAREALRRLLHRRVSARRPGGRERQVRARGHRRRPARVASREVGAFRIVVLASGGGTNLQAILDQLHGGEEDRGRRRRLRQARRDGAGASAAAPASRPRSSRRANTRTARRAIRRSATGSRGASADLVVLAGYMQLLSPEFVERFRNRVINVHPALLPAFPGIDALQQAIDHGVEDHRA